jgi:hypothetical protein
MGTSGNSSSNNPTPSSSDNRNQRSDSLTSRFGSRYNDRRQSLGQESVASESGGRFRSDSSGRAIEASGVGTYWEGKDLSRRPNIHRSHLSSSIHTGMAHLREINDRRNSADKSTDSFYTSTNSKPCRTCFAKGIYRRITLTAHAKRATEVHGKLYTGGS